MNLSAVVLTKNEEKSIDRTLSSLTFCDEILLLDSNSTDRTQEIAKKYKTRIQKRDLNNNFAGLRNYGLQEAKGDWTLFIDADEVVTKELADEIREAIRNGNFSVYYLKRRDYFWGRELKHGEVKKVREQGIIRLVKKNTGKWEGDVHEWFDSSSKTGRLKNFINHYPHPTIAEFLKDVNFYSTLRAKELHKKGKRVNVFGILLYPAFKFITSYLLRGGFLDGSAGFAYSFIMSFHAFLVRTKLYQYRNLANT
ncbi:hypothetical protein A3G67_04240 [Candidatus Roizmanbacteria bacterium RIFCSPLOWO2_12_FULL_40_12]|uniref:Glycosyltransferase 2-like domain-containing protein n=1 Tax=Candidatus Roizmanbacteria bacterium RIFCSPLOWO2_01_FULL_40_42 TaxID=1802066 RepID=A0A1F7J6N7_9BACT|nr:MAG: hypothetical protein A2779_00650 [Candidatus Roizmanbacteria bacterium RIFCSPHIGHO2_01_FULL_40_98]OGK29157.1 MAG: hypothetical protein A3C31_02625 [Candidatus Roizmanbacteria bacterium RIFCSPHIGHO2_02_FULL_40_53]OGK30716.1 MAG: hypothetical protein A2W49_01805 [Candidatus Roizmanbacteria bacterium RIFCSPHIGHO2_12_41_18]OGK37193.1 MAG: hypothetical protein A3E69_01835 [Candidatus Roizmanbacteria bacterium RIFCSPHIGHO2_12_FULL_40_130]OGK51267.1 MAG: hypothetical protein A3B50_04710 [Candi